MCPKCQNGLIDTIMKPCPQCNGYGFIRSFSIMWPICSYCHGDGTTGYNQCQKCKGTGRIEPVNNIETPVGKANNSHLELSNNLKGNNEIDETLFAEIIDGIAVLIILILFLYYFLFD